MEAPSSLQIQVSLQCLFGDCVKAQIMSGGRCGITISEVMGSHTLTGPVELSGQFVTYVAGR